MRGTGNLSSIYNTATPCSMVYQVAGVQVLDQVAGAQVVDQVAGAQVVVN